MDFKVTKTKEGWNIEGINQSIMFNMMAQEKALWLETKGMRHSRGSVYAHIKATYGLKGNKVKVHEQFKEIVEQVKSGYMGESKRLNEEKVEGQ